MKKNSKSSLSPSFYNRKDPKQLKNYVEEPMESESSDSSTGNDNTVCDVLISK